MLPKRIKDAAGMETTADYNYRLMQPARMTDPNGSSTHMVYSPIGLPLKQFVRGTDAMGGETLGGTEEKPEIRFDYNFLHFKQTKEVTGIGKAVYVQTTRRIHHASDNISDDTIFSCEYSDGYGRLIQTRAQAEEFIFGGAGDDVGLPAQPGVHPGSAVAYRTAASVIVSGWQVYDNKGRVIEKYEPFFSQGFDFKPEVKHGEHATMFYDPRGNVVRTLNPDGSQQRAILGRPKNPLDLKLDAAGLVSRDLPDSFEPTPWETYTYDANDLAPLCVAQDGASLAARAPIVHHFTPGSGIINALGRVLCQVQRNGSDPAKDWFITRTDYDLRGNALKIIDTHNRPAFKHSFDLLNRPLKVDSIDAGLRTSVLDAGGNLIEYRDTKGSLARRTYDNLNRPTELWARNDSVGRFTLRERIHYGDDGDHTLARSQNTLGKPVKYFDEAGLLETPEYDFKGNLLEKSRRTIRDDALAIGWQAEWEASTSENALEVAAYRTSSRYDGLNRPTEVTYPQDVDRGRKKLISRYNRAGALEAVALDSADYVQRIAYNAKGQRVLIAYGNGVMTRYAYDRHTFRLARLRTERGAQPAGSADTLAFQPSGRLIQDFAYSYDLAGNITTIDERTPNCGVLGSAEGRDRLLRQFDYDAAYRLTAATGRACKNIGVPRGLGDDERCGFYPGGVPTATQENAPELTEAYIENFSYDPSGNMLQLNYQAASGDWKRKFGMADLPNDRWREAQSNRLTSLENGPIPDHYRFDANGNMNEQNTERHHTWDHADRMIGYRVQTGIGSPASIEARYLYGADGMRVKKWVRNQQLNVNTTVYVDGAFERHRLTNPSGTRENNVLHVMDDQGRIAFARVGAPLHARDASPQVKYHFGDHLGSSHIVLGGDNATSDSFINREEHFPYGETSFGSFRKKRYRYSSKEHDEESGLYYFGARYLAPWLARWASCDPAGTIDGVNLFAFVGNNPVLNFDPRGTDMQSSNSISVHSTIDKQLAAPPVAGLEQVPEEWLLHSAAHDRSTDASNVADAGTDALVTEGANGLPWMKENSAVGVEKAARHAEKYFKVGELADKAGDLSVVEKERMTKQEYKRELAKNQKAVRQFAQEYNEAIATTKKGAPLTTRAVNIVLPEALKPGIGTKKGGVAATQKILEDAAKKAALLKNIGTGIRYFGRLMQGVGVATTVLEGSPAETGQAVDTFLDPHLADQVSSETRYFMELFTYAIGKRDAPPGLPPHMQYKQ